MNGSSANLVRLVFLTGCHTPSRGRHSLLRTSQKARGSQEALVGPPVYWQITHLVFWEAMALSWLADWEHHWWPFSRPLPSRPYHKHG